MVLSNAYMHVWFYKSARQHDCETVASLADVLQPQSGLGQESDFTYRDLSVTICIVLRCKAALDSRAVF